MSLVDVMGSEANRALYTFVGISIVISRAPWVLKFRLHEEQLNR
jgi:hypothetical protein